MVYQGQIRKLLFFVLKISFIKYNKDLFWGVQEMYRVGARRIIVVGVPPLGCMPLVKTLKNQRSCVRSMNRVASSFNAKLLRQLSIMKAKLGLKTAYVDAYGTILSAVINPTKHGQYQFLKFNPPNTSFQYKLIDI